MKTTLLQAWGDSYPFIEVTKPSATGEGVIDAGAFNSIEIKEVFEAVNHAKTLVGQAVLYRSLCQPLTSEAEINKRQEALKELQQNPELKIRLGRIIDNAASSEKAFYTLLFAEFIGSTGIAKSEHQITGYGYKQYLRGRRLLLELVDLVQTTDRPSSTYLTELFDKVDAFAKSRCYSLMANSVYISEKGIKSKEERVGDFTPAVIFRPTLFKPLLIGAIFFAIWLLVNFFPTDIFSFSARSIPTLSIFFIPVLLAYIPIVGGYDRNNCIMPLREEFKKASEVGNILDALGQFDELLSFDLYAQNSQAEMILPTIINEEHHQISLVNVKNPVLAKNNPDYVGNNLTISNERLILITGPNSGGKTAFCKTITQVQLLAQIGCYIPAEQACLNIADKIFYQVPEISHLDDGEGRFGTELKRTKDIFLATTSKSLVILDELSEGTTFEEKLESSTNVLDGFYRKGNTTILITHNHQLVDGFINKGIGIAKQVEFANEAPTYKLIDGISRVSHADRVAKKIGFSKQDIDNYLQDSK